MSARSRLLGLGAAAVVLVGLVALPADSVAAAPAQPVRPAALADAGSPVRVVPVRLSGLYELSADGEVGWLLLHHNPRTNLVAATAHLNGHARREYLRARYYPAQGLLRLTRVSEGYQHEYSLWLSYRLGARPSFGGFGDRYPLSFHGSAAERAIVTVRYGVHVRYVADDMV